MKKVLIIDDEVDLCLMIKHFLTKRNYEVYVAHTLSEGFRHLNSLVPDAIILDNNLPDGMGWDIAESILQKFPAVHITLISAYRLAKDFKPSLKGAIKILEKPVSLTEIEHLLL